MIDTLKRFFNANEGTQQSAMQQEQETIVAVCALFLEMGRIDRPFSDQELEHVLTIIIEKFDLSRDLADALIQEADHELENSVDLWQFARVINETFSNEKKLKLIERLWEVVYVDGQMDSHERYLMNKLSKLLRISHKQLINRKLKVLHSR
jgi:uncharacterized tellurite resistance protein B-like protein